MNDALDEIFDESGDEEQDARCGIMSLGSLGIYLMFKMFSIVCSERCVRRDL